MKAQSKLGVFVLAASLMTGCNVYIDVPVAVGPSPTEAPPVAEPTPVAATPIVTTLPTIVIDPTEPVVSVPTTMSVNLQWTPPNQREDGTLLTESELSLYEIRYRAEGEETFEVVQVDAANTSLPITDLPIASYEFQIAAIDNDGLYSDFVSATQQ
ncbi:fibronectin type III domain-containing protein [Salinibius halmophilus]|uniref:fibronectin type III domain-containing protein n=1 Tax=Salinibius halmophilus TaxID=1853216 RepID=UPI000E661591|nr:fibronectin type III domain-containing protein [Salinibius halmophilus]